MEGPSLNAIGDRYADNGIGSLFIYTHEAHPGENYPHHTSLTQKLEHARAMQNAIPMTRRMVVDRLDGTCHRYFGSMPNMTWIISGSGLVVYRASWTDAHSVENALHYFLDVDRRRQGGERMAPFRVERIDYRNHDRAAFFKGLENSGPKAVQEFREAFG